MLLVHFKILSWAVGTTNPTSAVGICDHATFKITRIVG